MRVRGDKSVGGERGLKVGREYFNVYFHRDIFSGDRNSYLSNFFNNFASYRLIGFFVYGGGDLHLKISS